MKINNIIIENFQSYFQTSSFEFKEGVNLILGENGGGKSTLFNAFYWVLFDLVYETDIGWEDLDVKFLNARTRDLLKNNESANLSVTLKIEALNYINREDAENVQYTFYRKVKFRKSNNIVKMDHSDDLKISFKNTYGETVWIDDHEINNCIEFLLPEAIRDYIWFQGETISDLIDFNNSSTLNNAIDKISYFPHYRTISEIIGQVRRTSENDINKHVRSSDLKNKKLRSITNEIENNYRKLKNAEISLDEQDKKIDNLKQTLSNIEVELAGVSDNQDLADKMKLLDAEENSLKKEIDSIEQNQRESIINKWMLKGIDPFIKVSEKKINAFLQEIREKSKNDNPIPVDVPGSVFVQAMLDDEKCHICLRDAPVGSDSYKALEDKLNSSIVRKKAYEEKDKEFRNLEQNFLSLVSIPKNVLDEISNIPDEIKDFFTKQKEGLTRRNDIRTEKKEILNDAGITDESKLTSNSTLLKRLLSKQQNINYDLKSAENQRRSIFNNIHNIKSNNKSLENDRDSKYSDNKNKIPQQLAKPYIEVLELITKKLEETAKENLINEIEKKSTELLHGYLESSLAFKGFIKIDRENYDVKVVDSSDIIVPINKGNLTAAKMSVINSILFLSSVKLQKDYPIISDAPSSVFDLKNTKSYMNKIGDTFPQVIIMTKDLYDMNLNDLKSINNVNRVYKLVNTVIDKNTEGTISNYCTVNGAPII